MKFDNDKINKILTHARHLTDENLEILGYFMAGVCQICLEYNMPSEKFNEVMEKGKEIYKKGLEESKYDRG